MEAIEVKLIITITKGFIFGLILMLAGLEPNELLFYWLLILLIIIGSFDSLL